MEEERYSKDNILEYPKLAPTRHYESKNPKPWRPPARQIPQRDPLLDNLDDLDNLKKICDLLPPDLGMTIQAITDVLSKHTQGLIIMRIEHDIKHPPGGPVVPRGHTYTPGSPEDTRKPGTWEGPEDPDHPHPPEYEPGKYNPPKIPEFVPEPGHKPKYEFDEQEHHGRHEEYNPSHPGEPGYVPPEKGTYDRKPIGPGDKIGPGKEIWPPAHSEYGKGGFREDHQYIYIPADKTTDEYDVIVPEDRQDIIEDPDVDDIFSAAPDVEISIEPTESLVDLSRKGYMQDDADIKEHYSTTMTQISQRFFQVMTALAEDGNFLDYSDLMQDFDGTAVKTADPSQQHLIDEICRNQVLYDQKLRQMNLTHTPEKTLIMTRAMTAAEGERERYLGEDYKTNMPTISSGLSNDLLQKAREDSEKKYKEAAYNMYKFLDSATKYTNAMLNMKIDSAIAKAQLANTGSDIFAVTPPPQPLADHVDDNFDTTVKYQEKTQKFIDEQKKDSKKGSEVDNGSSGGNSTPGKAVANVGELGTGAIDPKSVWDALHKAGYNDIATAAIMGSIMQESRFSPSADNGSHHGLAQWDHSGRWAALSEWAGQNGKNPDDGGTQVEYIIYEACNVRYPEECCPDGMNQYGSVWDASEAWLKWFEGALGQQDQERADFGQGFYEQYSGKKS